MTYRNPPNVREVRLRAWETRRKKYGQRGHRGSYSRSANSTPACEGMLALLIDLHLAAQVSEGQLSRATGLHRIEVRRLVDEYRLRTGKDYVEAA